MQWAMTWSLGVWLRSGISIHRRLPTEVSRKLGVPKVRKGIAEVTTQCEGLSVVGGALIYLQKYTTARWDPGAR